MLFNPGMAGRTFRRVAGGGDITSGLVGWWKFDDGSGTTAVDSGSGGNNGTLSGGTLPTWVGGHIGSNALSFPGADSYVAIGATPVTSGNLTIAAWINITASVFFDTIFTAPDIFNNMIYGVRLNGAGTAIQLLFDEGGAGQTVVNGGTSLSTSTWTHVAATYDATTLTLYINGVSDGSSASAAYGTPVAIRIGAAGLGSLSKYFNGLIDDVRLYSRALTPADITALYAYT
jgi:hypothetical protein